MESYLPLFLVTLAVLAICIVFLAIKVFFRRQPAMKGACCSSVPDVESAGKEHGSSSCGCGCH